MARSTKNKNLLEGSTADGDATEEPMLVGDLRAVTVQVSGMESGDEVTIEVSNDPREPENWDTEATFTEGGAEGLTPGYRWLRARRSGTGDPAGTVTVRANGHL